MHTDLSSHLHSDKCNELIKLLEECRREHPFTRLFGKCNSEDHKMIKCLKEERQLRRQKNYEKSLATKEKLRRLFQEERKKEQQEAQVN